MAEYRPVNPLQGPLTKAGPGPNALGRSARRKPMRRDKRQAAALPYPAIKLSWHQEVVW